MADMTPFVFEDHLVRVVLGEDGEPWWVARDVCRALEIRSPESAYERIPSGEKGIGQADTLGGAQDLVIVSEPGLYRLIFRSDKPAAERFRSWVFAEVLPAIRRTGRYEAPGAAEPAERPEIGPTGDLNTRLRMVEVVERLAGRAAARRMWQALGLPPIDEDGPLDGLTDPDGLHRFFAECCHFAPGAATATLALHAAYAAWATARGLAPATVTALGRALAARGLRRRKGHGHRRPTEWVGVGFGEVGA